ncbi:T9SS type A sorting domain-containing protein [Bacteroidota bacterium]
MNIKLNRLLILILLIVTLDIVNLKIQAQTILFSPDTLYMGTIPVGSHSVREMIVYNTSSTTMNISKIEISGDTENNFTILNNPGTASLGQLQSVDLEIQYSPINSDPHSVELVVTSNTSTSPDRVVIFGSGSSGSPITFERLFGDEENDGLSSVQQTPDGGYILAGSTLLPSEDFNDFYIVKTDNNGLMEWSAVHGDDETENANTVLQTGDGNYMVFGQTNSEGAGHFDYYLMKISSSGEKIWDKTYGGNKDESAGAMVKTDDGGYILVGSTRSFGDEFSTDLFIIKVSADGNVIWEKTYGGSGGESVNEIIRTNDGGYVMVGTTGSYGAGSFDVYIVKINASGNLVWEKTFGGTGDEEGNDIVELNDGSFAISGYTVSFGAGAKDFLLLNVNSSGDEVWYNVYGGIYQDVASNIVTTGNEIIAMGYISQSTQRRSFNIIMTDLDGNLIKQVSAPSGKVGVGANDAIVNNEGNLLIVGSSGSYSSSSEAYILNTAEFNQTTSVEESHFIVTDAFELHQNYPNPFNNQTQITFTLKEPSNIILSVYNITGSKVETLLNKHLKSGLHKVIYNGVGLATGVYFVELKSRTYTQSRKIILLK